ncbi:hypothetical protein MTR67_049139 [Solanum verrucosum]|uniref:DNA replication complex GINS protein SLD5 C-terminal domain-containing protein n=1 Tax=Solanum verrucosum TaxID=315347 RepID=A0AAF0V235_SOLVR|nr:hypothetical protein MTR67_049139 [Solanum verrucosum]
MIRCIDDTKEHLVQSVLSELTYGIKSHLKQSSLSLADDMVPGPQLNQYVLCRSKTFFESFQLNDSGEKPMNIEANDLDALPYKSIKSLVESGQIDLTHGVKSHLKQSSLSLEDDMNISNIKIFRIYVCTDTTVSLLVCVLVPEPQLDQYVLCISTFLNLFSFMTEPVNIEVNNLDALPYKSIKPLVESGQIDLFIMLITWMIRCIDDTEEHLAQSVLSELTHGVKSHLKQSSLSLADDMELKRVSGIRD